MIALIESLFLIPIAISALLLALPKNFIRIVTIAAAVVLSFLSVYLYTQAGSGPVRFAVPAIFDRLVTIVDFVLLGYIIGIGVVQKYPLISILALIQVIALAYLATKMPETQIVQFYVDKLSMFMFILVNVISSVIAIYSLKYIDEENCGPFRKKYFISTIFWFIAAMNLLAAADNLEYFYLFFKLTTIASYLFIRFRKDELSEKNARTALWMNQFGGITILGAIAYSIFTPQYGYPFFSDLISKGNAVGIMMPFALLGIAGMIKGAQYPFSKWLIGAMVAPTPVSALLHSSTMVKIAPFIMLRISPVIKGTHLATIIIALTAFVFVAAAIGALAQDTFKKILAHSTIALLALMILMAAVGTPVAVTAALILILFHGLSKGLLFLNAGVLEHVFHLKQTSDMNKLGEVGPFSALVVAIGFMSLLLPPFGAFVGKWFSIETIGSAASGFKIIGALVLVCIASGSAVLSLLYFKVLGAMISRTGESDKVKFEHIDPMYKSTLLFLLFALLACTIALPWLLPDYFTQVAMDVTRLTSIPVVMQGTNIYIGAIHLPLIPMVIALVLLPLGIIAGLFVRFKKVDRVKEYMCGEKAAYDFSSFYFSTDKAASYFAAIGVLFFVSILLVAFFM